ncbi:MAG: polyprenyl synthetase family protein [Anaerolineae bacterium]|nr:polyprenyl synthetase family protein [Anaerolineae bacterium]
MHREFTVPNMAGENSPSPSLEFVTIYSDLLLLIEANLASVPGKSTDVILKYLQARGQQLATIKQDLLPLLIYVGVSGRSYQEAVPLAACWALYLAAAHLLDDAQDNGRMPSANGAVAALGAANLTLVNASVARDAMFDILDAFSNVAVIGANAQAAEKKDRRLPSRTEYFQSIAGKAAVIIATGVWAGGRLATNNPDTLSLLKEFGLAWGMATQISDDCQDLAEDLANGLHTLPVIEGLSRVDHPHHSLLKKLVGKTDLDGEEIETVLTILEEMGSIVDCRRLIRAYQVQATAVFNTLPGLKPFFEA